MPAAIPTVPASCAPHTVAGEGEFFFPVAGLTLVAGFKAFYSERLRAMSRRWISCAP